MDGWLAKASSAEAQQIPGDQLIQWHITLTTVHDECVRLQDASQAAVDAFLLRPASADSPADSRHPTGQRLYQRLAAAMAELEQVLVELKGGED